MSFDRAKLRNAIKKKDGWWASIFAGPLANRLLEPICEINWISPNLITISSLFIGLIASYFFLKANHQDLIIGGILVQLSFVVDCMDGQLARYRQESSNLGAWLDRISDRIKDFFYFFSLALGFYLSHDQFFYLGFTGLGNFISNFIKDDFLLPQNFQIFLMKTWVLPSWIIFPIAMIAMFTIFLIDYYVNQDMKLEASSKQIRSGKNKSITNRLSAPRLFLNFSFKVYESIPILRFNIGEQALLLSIFTILDSVFFGLCFFALLGTFYSIIWPFMRLNGIK